MEIKVEAMTNAQRMKWYEKHNSAEYFMPMLPVYIRLDGRAFHTFTRGMKRPFDPTMSSLMTETTKYLVEQSNALIGYTQSDEISLVYESKSFDSQIFFDGRKIKIITTLASMAGAKFTQLAMDAFPDRLRKMLPTFDARGCQFPNRTECVNMILWRVRDAIKNSVTMSAQSVYSDKELHGVNTEQKLDLLIQKNINWNNYPRFFKEGSFARRVTTSKLLTIEELMKIPEKHRPTGEVLRSVVVELDTPPFQKILNKEAFIFEGQAPSVAELISTRG